jgi:transposase
MITIGVDPHRTVNEAAALDEQGRLVGRWRGANDAEGWAALAVWAEGQGNPREYGVEGAWSYGRGLAQYLVGGGEVVFNVSPHLTAKGRRRARKRGKSDGQDAEAVARVVRQEGGQLPEVTGEDETNVLNELNGERELVKGESARLQNHLRALLRQLDPVYERGLKSLTTKRTLAELKVYQGTGSDAVQTARASTVRRLSQRLESTLGHMAEITREMEELVRVRFRTLTSICGVDLLTAAQLAAEMGPGQRFTSDAALASWGGTAPIEASSGANVRHRLSRVGNRQFNAIVHRIAVTQLRYSVAAKSYVDRRRQEGKTKREAMRALKRYIVRAIFQHWVLCFQSHVPPRTTFGCT